MADQQNQTATKNPWWLALVQVGVSIGMSYLTARETQGKEWVKDGYRDAMVQGIAATALQTAAEQVAKLTQQQTNTQQ